MTRINSAIVLATDSHFVGPVSCVLAMIDEYSPDATVCVLHDAVDEDERTRATHHVPQLSVSWTDVSPLLSERLVTTQHFTRMSYARLVIATALPNLERALYLDADILIRRSVQPLLEADLHGLPIAACLDLNATTLAQGLPNFSHWHLDGTAPYFNGGVLVVDLHAWREFGLTNRAVALAEQSSALLGWADQDVINIVAGGSCHRLDATWNVLHGGWGRRAHRSRVGDAISATELASALRDPAIVHFAGSIKPWHARFGGRLSTSTYVEWRRFAKRTPYARDLLGGATLAMRRSFWSPFVRAADRYLRRRERENRGEQVHSR
jgi:lipopolysaccharide biosynthesis glycosyltransferase